MTIEEMNYEADIIFDQIVENRNPVDAHTLMFILHIKMYYACKHDGSNIEEYIRDYSSDFVKSFNLMRGLQ